MDMSDKTLEIFAEEYCIVHHKDLFAIEEDDAAALKEFLNNMTEFARKEGYITINQLNPDGYFVELTEKGKEFVNAKLGEQGK